MPPFILVSSSDKPPRHLLADVARTSPPQARHRRKHKFILSSSTNATRIDKSDSDEIGAPKRSPLEGQDILPGLADTGSFSDVTTDLSNSSSLLSDYMDVPSPWQTPIAADQRTSIQTRISVRLAHIGNSLA